MAKPKFRHSLILRSSLLFLILAIVISSALSCRDGIPDETSSGTESVISDPGTSTPESSEIPGSVTASPVTTAAPVTSLPETTAAAEIPVSPDALEAASEQLGFVPVFARVEAGVSVWVKTEKGVTYISPLSQGSSSVTFYNSYGETASATVEVGADLKPHAVYVRFAPPERSVSVLDLGAKQNQAADSTKAFQDGINMMSEAGGGTVYVPIGTYRINSIQMKPGVSLRLEGFLPDATVGYTKDLAAYATGGKAAVIATSGSPTLNIFIYNTPLPKAYCTEGVSDFSVSGGVFLCQAKMKFAAVVCGENITFENIIIKDVPNNHAFQIDGCSGVTLKNIMFAGYNYPATNPVLTRETIQLEPTTPGAITSSDSSPVQCYAGDYHQNSNIKILGCYFGKSDLYGPQLVGIGHHSGTGAVSCRGLVISGCVFDNPLYCGIHLPNISDVEISGNTFISDSAPTTGKLADDSALLSLYSFSNDQTYTSPGGSKVVFAYGYEQDGLRNIMIENNTFRLGGKTPLIGVYIAGNTVDNKMNATYVKASNTFRCEAYGGTEYPLNGYLIRTNTAYNITLRGNRFSFPTKPAYSSSYISLKSINGFFFENNILDLGEGVKFNSNSYFGNGIYVPTKTVYSDRYTMLSRKISIDSGAPVSVTVTDGSSSFPVQKPKVNCTLNIQPTEGGRVELTADIQGNLTINLIADEGYAFSGFVKEADNSPFDLSTDLVSGINNLLAVFVKK